MWIRILARNDHQRALLSIPTTNFNTFFVYFICVIALPALWAIVTEAIYDERESNNFVRTYAPYFTKAERTHVPKDGFVRGYGNANIMGQTAGSTR